MADNILIGVLGFIGIMLVIYAITGVKIVRQNEVLIIERLGKFSRQLNSGLGYVVPFLDRVVQVHDLRQQVLDSQPQPVITKDNVSAHVDTVSYYQITDPYRATYEINGLKTAIQLLINTTLRDIIGKMELDELYASREKIGAELLVILDQATDKWGVKVHRVEVKDIVPPKEILDAMERQMKAERIRREQIALAEGEKASSILQAEGRRDSAIRDAEGKQKSEILVAEGERQKRVLEAKGEAEAIKSIAEAQASQIKLVFDALKSAEIDESMLQVKYIEALVEMAKSSNKVFVPFQSAGFLGSIGAISDLLKENPTTVKSLPSVQEKSVIEVKKTVKEDTEKESK